MKRLPSKQNVSEASSADEYIPEKDSESALPSKSIATKPAKKTSQKATSSKAPRGKKGRLSRLTEFPLDILFEARLFIVI